jgi:hypothetical protein
MIVYSSATVGKFQGLGAHDQFCELLHFMNMYNYFLRARVSLRTLFSLVINLFTQVAIVLELALVSLQVPYYRTITSHRSANHKAIDSLEATVKLNHRREIKSQCALGS